MPKVPPSTYVATQGVPGAAPLEYANASVMALPYRTAEQGFDKIEATGLLAHRHFQVIEFEKEKQRQADALLAGVQTAAERITDAENELRFGKVDPDGTIAEAPATSADYLSRWQTHASQIQRDVLAGTTDEAVSQLLNRELSKKFGLRSFDARRHATKLYVDEQEAEADAKENQALRLYVNETDPEEAELNLKSIPAMARSQG